MKVVFDTNTVLPKLTQVASVINSKNQMQALTGICFTINGSKMIVTGSDGETWVTLCAEVINQNDDNCMFCVSAQDIIKCLSSLKDEVVSITLDEEHKLLNCDYGNGNISMPYESADDFPKPAMDMEECFDIVLHSSCLSNAIQLSQTAIANDELRPIMNGIYFSFNGDSMTCNACNFLKMVRYRKAIKLENVSACEFAVPKKPALLLLSILSETDEDVRLRFTDKALSVSNKNFKVTARLLEGHYPSCDRIIPDNAQLTVEVEKNSMVQALRHALSVDNSGSLVSLMFGNDKITVSSENVTLSKSATESLPCSSDSQLDFSICFNGVALIEILKNIDDDFVVFELSSPTNPAVVYSKDKISKDEYLSLIMPMSKLRPTQQETT